jgi:hypothetical protein
MEATTKELESARRRVRLAALDALSTGLLLHGPNAVGVILLGLATTLITGLVLLIGVPAWSAGLGAGAAAGAQAMRRRTGSRTSP